MNSDDLVEAVAILNPGALARARRLTAAIRLVRAGHKPREAAVIIRQQHACGRTEAWEIVSMALDMAAPKVRSER